MKLPPALEKAMGALSAMAASFAKAAASLPKAAASLAGRLRSARRPIARETLPLEAEPAPFGAPAARAGPNRMVLAAIVAGASALALAAMIIIAASGKADRAEAAPAYPGAALARELVIPGPGPGERPWPLALEPKARYTEAEAAALRPDLGAIDVSEYTRQRKAELEAMYDAVD